MQYRKVYSDELCHHGILGMHWGVRHDYSSNGIRARRARRANDKVDAGFKNWNENAKKRDDAIDLGKKANVDRMSYESNRSDKNLKKQYKGSKKAYEKALESNTTYRKGVVRQEVGKDISRKYLSEAKRIKKEIDANPGNRELKKKYNDMMSKHDLERAKARRAVSVSQKRSRKAASIKRMMTMTVKTAATGAIIAGGAYAANRYFGSHNMTMNGKALHIGAEQIGKFAKAGKSFMNMAGYMY